MRRAFSLVELSIVLVILGLLVGGILAGQSLIRAAELRAVNTEFSRFLTAGHSFRDKYFALPGDMNNATSFWGTASFCPGGATQGSTTAATCNGDGDGSIEWSGGTAHESFRAWQHLANAGLIEGTYSGVGGTPNTNYNSVIGTGVPASKLTPAGWTLATAHYTGNSWIPDVSALHRNILWFGADNPNEWTSMPALTPTEAWNIDTKMDDGVAGTGKVIGSYWNTCTDGASSADTSAQYLLASSTKLCPLMFLTGL